MSFSNLSKKNKILEVEYEIAHLICTDISPESSEVIFSIIEVIKKSCNDYSTSIKYGKFLLFILQKMGEYLCKNETFILLFNGHKSGLKRSITNQIKKYQ